MTGCFIQGERGHFNSGIGHFILKRLIELEKILSKTRLYIIEEHDGVRRALVERLNRSPVVEVVGHTSKADQAISAVEDLSPDIIVVEVKRSDGLGLEILRLLSKLASRR